jgi:tRNA A37 threonylcarbamoyladenosine biosynthesis protein TsaE
MANVLAAEESVLGQQLGRYELLRRLGAGGMGEVFEARHLDSGERVALKTLSHTHVTLRHRFKREFRALADLTHPNIISLGELVVPEQGAAFFTMELTAGLPLVSWVRNVPLIDAAPPLERLEHALRQLLVGLAHLHARRRVHRDLKPSNVLVDEHGRVVILDFGLVLELDSDVALTRESQRLGTVVYMAPEQTHTARVEPAADIYAVGVMLFECLTGRVPWSGSMAQILVAKQTEPLPDLRSLPASVPLRLRELCMRMLARDPNQRPSAHELVDEFGGRPTLTETRPPPVCPDQELAQLHAALTRVQLRQACVTVHVRGRAGSGKSSLLRRFVSGIHAQDALVLRARCRVQETVSYKAFDGIVEGLAVYLRSLPAARRDTLRPARVDALVSTFPAFEHVWPHEAVPAGSSGAVDEPHRLAWVGLRDVIVELARFETPILIIDDFQWADADSIALLHALTQPPQAPASLLVIAYRPDMADRELLRCLAMSERVAERDVQSLELVPPTEIDPREQLDDEAVSVIELPHVGRTRELRMLSRLFEECVSESGRAQVVIVAGAPGLGKSRLARELLRALSSHATKPTIWMAKAEPTPAGVTLERLLGHVHTDTHAASTPQGQGSSTPAIVQEIFARSLAAACEQAPVVLVLDDLHCSDTASIEALDRVLTELGHQQLFVLGLARAELRDRFPRLWSAHSPTELHMGALPRKAARQLVRLVLGEAPNATLVERIVELSEGNASSLLAHARAVLTGRSTVPHG